MSTTEGGPGLAGRLKKYRAAAVGVLLAAAVYARVGGLGFTGLDDELLVRDNLSFLSDPANVTAVFSREVFDGRTSVSYYRPLLTLSLMADTLAGGGRAWVYHISNALLHAAVCLALYALLLALGRGPGFAAPAALLFCLHPLAVAAVAWVPGRNELLLALFALLAFKAFIAFYAGSRRALWVHAGLYACALFSKESAVMLPPLLAAWALTSGLGAAKLKRPALVWLAVTAAWLAARSAALQSAPAADYDIAASLWRNLPALLPYLGKMLLPVGLAVRPVLADLSYGPGLGLLLLCCLAVYTRLLRPAGALFALLWCMLWLLPALIKPSGIMPEFGEHRAYLPLAALAFAAGELRLAYAPARMAFAAWSLLVVFAALSWTRIPQYRDYFSFWSAAVRTSPSCPVNRVALGTLYLKAGACPEAGAQLSQALALAPADAAASRAFSRLLLACGKPRQGAAGN